MDVIKISLTKNGFRHHLPDKSGDKSPKRGGPITQTKDTTGATLRTMKSDEKRRKVGQG